MLSKLNDNQETLIEYLDDLASSSPAPGGGGAAAITGAQAAALLSMVANLTIGKKKYKDVEERVKILLKQSELLRSNFIKLADDDKKAFNNYMNVSRETKGNPNRPNLLEQASIQSASIPLLMIEETLKLLPIAKELAEIGNINLISDVGVAVYLAEATAMTAKLNVQINLNFIKEESFVNNSNFRMSELVSKIIALKSEVFSMPNLSSF